MKIKSVDIALCPLPLARPINLGTVAMKTRDYVLTRITTDCGREGYGIGFRSGTPLLDTLAALAPALIGRDPLTRRQILTSIEESSVPGRSALIRAMSMVDLALWDIAAKVSDLPLYRYLGGSRREVPLVAVAGFSYTEREEQDVVDEVTRLADRGIHKIKILINGKDSLRDARYVTRIAKALDGRASLVVDAHWSWRNLPAALETCSRIDELGLGFIEDPFLPQQWRLTSELRSRLKTPLAAGEDVLDLYGVLDLIGSVDVLRIDATSNGGISGALAALELAAAFGRSVVPHVFPYVHGHLACSHLSISSVEFIPEETGADPINILLDPPPTITNGHLVASEAPGIGLALAWSAVAAQASVQRTFN
jgi:L-alanine-DL-glutamate epimerase-like enolase superfamily enzyme